MPAGVGQWVWVSDFKGFGLSDCDPRLAKVFLDLSAAHYPERLGLFIVVDAPWSASHAPSIQSTQTVAAFILAMRVTPDSISTWHQLCAFLLCTLL